LDRRFGLFFGAAMASMSPATVRAEMPPGDPDQIITLQIENDFLNLTDRNHSSGLRLGWISPSIGANGDPYLPHALADFGTSLWGEGRQRISIDISETIFTPKASSRRRQIHATGLMPPC
jgi:hypothetical protein